MKKVQMTRKSFFNQKRKTAKRGEKKLKQEKAKYNENR